MTSRAHPRALSLLALSSLAILASAQAPAATSPHAGTFATHAVASDTALASDAGLAILEAGGNAADAAAATMLALGVASPASSGIGGGGFALYYRASDRSLTFIDFRETAPAAASAAMFARGASDSPPSSTTGGLAVAVPGEPAGIDALLTRFGSGRVRRDAIVAPAVRLARDGFPASHYVSRYSSFVEAAMRGDPLLASWLPAQSGAIAEGTVLRNPALGDTLAAFGRQGPRAIYRGRVAAEIERAVRARGGVLTAADLAAYRVAERTPLRATRLGYTFVVAPPPSAGGFTMLHSLALLERWWAGAPPRRDGAALRHALAESWIGAFDDRRRYLGDPDHVAVPLDALLADARLGERASRFDPRRALSPARWALPLAESDRALVDGAESGTSHLCVVDGEGNVAAITTTVNLPFGARVTAAGILLNDEMDDFASEVGAPNEFGLPGGAGNLPGPGRRPVSTMSPTIVLEGGEPVLCVGASGGSRIVTATQQVALFTLLLGDPIDEAIARPRVHHQGVPFELSYERGLPTSTLYGLWARRHALRDVESSAVVQAIRIRRTDGGARELHAASDPRKRGEPRGR